MENYICFKCGCKFSLFKNNNNYDTFLKEDIENIKNIYPKLFNEEYYLHQLLLDNKNYLLLEFNINNLHLFEKERINMRIPEEMYPEIKMDRFIKQSIIIKKLLEN